MNKFFFRKIFWSNKKLMKFAPPGFPDPSPTSPGPQLRFLKSIYKIQIQKFGNIVSFTRIFQNFFVRLSSEGSSDTHLLPLEPY